MKNWEDKISIIKNPFLKLIYLDCFVYAEKNNAVIEEYILKDILLNKHYENLFKLEFVDEKFVFDVVLKKTDFFLKKIQKKDIKLFNLTKEDVGKYFFEDVFEKIQEKIIYEYFYQNGIDPVLFIKSAFSNLKKNKKYQFENLDVVLNKYEDLNKKEKIKENNVKKEKIENENFYIDSKYKEGLYHDDIVSCYEVINYNSEKLLNVKKIKDQLVIINDDEVKNSWENMITYLVNEGKTVKEANAIIGKLLKEETTYQIISAFNKIRKRKTTPINLIAAIKMIINEENEKQQEKEKFIQY